jgi:hypothetical protein
MSSDTDLDDVAERLAEAYRHAIDLWQSGMDECRDRLVMADEARDLLVALRAAERSLRAARAALGGNQR